MKKNDNRYIAGQALIGLAVFLLIYTYFYYSRVQRISGAGEEWGIAILLSLTAVLVGMLVELGRFWGWVIEVRIDANLLVLQGIPAAILSLIPGPVWLQAGGNTYPFIFFADPVVTGVSGVWLGVVVFRSVFNNKKLKDEEEIKDKMPGEQ